jgi:hypothetical protein
MLMSRCRSGGSAVSLIWIFFGILSLCKDT